MIIYMNNIAKEFRVDEYNFKFGTTYKKSHKAFYDHNNIYQSRVKEGWYIYSLCKSHLNTCEAMTLTKWCKDSLSSYWAIGFDCIYISKEEDFIQFKLAWM
jgi:hypothetical protein